MKEDNKDRIRYNPDFINIKRFNYDLNQLLERFDDSGVPDHVIENALDISQEEADELYKNIVTKLQKLLNVKI